jgi:hypothetical protein
MQPAGISIADSTNRPYKVYSRETHHAESGLFTIIFFDVDPRGLGARAVRVGIW